MTAQTNLLREVLARSQELGFLGPGPVHEHIDHAQALLQSVPSIPQFMIDLGSGGGIPGLVFACLRVDLTGVLLDGSTRRVAFLREAIDELGLTERFITWEGRAEDLGRNQENRGIADLVVARSFGPPAVVAECAAPFLRVGGRLIVSDPPGTGNRWPRNEVDRFGLTVYEQAITPPKYTVLLQETPCPTSFPRRVGIPAKRPLF